MFSALLPCGLDSHGVRFTLELLLHDVGSLRVVLLHLVVLDSVPTGIALLGIIIIVWEGQHLLFKVEL